MRELQHREQRVAVLIDVQNMYYSAKHLYNTKVNFKEIMNSAVAGRRLVRAVAYAIKADVKDENTFHDALNKVGIEVKAKDLLVFYGGSKKGDWDIGIAMDAVRLSKKVDTIVLISGDGDFKDLLTYLKQHGLRTEVIAFGRTASSMIKQEADLFVDMEKNKNKYLINKPRYEQNKHIENYSNKKDKDKENNKANDKKTSKKTTKKPARKISKKQSSRSKNMVKDIKKAYDNKSKAEEKEKDMSDLFGDDKKEEAKTKKKTEKKDSNSEGLLKKIGKKLKRKKE